MTSAALFTIQTTPEQSAPTQAKSRGGGGRLRVELDKFVGLKRSYPSGTPTTPTVSGAPGYAGPTTSAPPLPPGPPPPAPPAGTTSAYGYGPGGYGAPPAPAGQVTAHPQYPGYGYGAPAAPAQPAAPYPNYAQQPPQPQYNQQQQQPPPPPPPAYGYRAGAPAPPAGGYAYGGAPPPPAGQYNYPAQGYGAGSPYPAAAPPPPPPQLYGYGVPPPGGAQPMSGVQMSPQGAGAPPFKRTRYDQQQAMGGSPSYPPGGYNQGPPPPMGGGPPPALPPVGGPPRGGGRGGYAGSASSRGGYEGGGGRYGPGSPVHPSSGYDRGPAYPRGPDRGDYRGGPDPRDFDYRDARDYRHDDRDLRPREPPMSSRGGFGGSSRGGPAGRGGRGGLAPRPHAGLPRPPVPGVDAPKGPRGAPRGPAAASVSGLSAVNSASSRKERKWGDGAADKGKAKKDENKDTLTDFRIEGLEVGAPVEWGWEGDAKKKRNEALASSDKTEASEAPAVEEVPAAEDEGDETVGDMSLDVIPAPIADAAEGTVSPTVVSDASKAASHADEDTSSPSTDAPATVEPSPAGSVAAEGTATTESNSVEATAASVAEDTPKKPLSKKQKRKEAAARRASAAAEAEAAAVEKNAKHGREESPSAVDETADTSDVPGAKKPKVGDTKASLPAKPSTGIPTGPKNAVVKTKEMRENSRLRFYFSSPVELPKEKKVEVKTEAETKAEAEVAVKEEIDALVEAAADASLKVEVKQEEGTAAEEENVDGEAVDGDAVDGEPVDVDGEPVDGEPLAEVAADETAEKVDEQPPVPAEEGQAVVKEEEGTAEATEAASAEEAIAPTDAPKEVSAENEQTSSTATSGAEARSSSTSAADVTVPEPVDGPVQEDEAPEAAIETVATATGPAADRVSISYARNTRRIVFDAAIVASVRIHRAEGRIELLLNLERALLSDGSVDPLRICKGILVETLDEGAEDYRPVDRSVLTKALPECPDDPLLPPLYKLLAEQVEADESGLTVQQFAVDQILVTAFLDLASPLTEARWVKTGEIEPWIVSVGIANGQDPKKDSLSEWKGKIEVVDPDSPPTMQQALEAWAAGSTVGTVSARSTFVSSHLSNLDNLFEILLRLTRSNGATNNPAQQPPAVGALAASLSSPYPEHQTQVSLAVLAMLRLSLKTASRAGDEALLAEVEGEVREVVRSIPWHLSFKALDGMMREFLGKNRGKK